MSSVNEKLDAAESQTDYGAIEAEPNLKAEIKKMPKKSRRHIGVLVVLTVLALLTVFCRI